MLEINTASTSSSLSSTASASTFLQLELTLAEHILSSDHRILAELNRIKNLSDEELPEPPAISTVPSMYNNISDKQGLVSTESSNILPILLVHFCYILYHI